MKIKVLAFQIMVLVSIWSCNNGGVEIIITNKRDTTLKNVHIGNTDPAATIKIPELKKDETHTGVLSFKNAPNVDGTYDISINGNENLKDNFGFGYFSNGISLDKKIRITLYNDTCIIKYQPGDF